jgi:hypothetical protein
MSREFLVQANASKAIAGTLCIMPGGQIINPTVGAVILANESLTDDTGGTPSQTLAAVTAGAGYSQADAVAMKNAISSLAASLNAVIQSLENLGIGLTPVSGAGAG